MTAGPEAMGLLGSTTATAPVLTDLGLLWASMAARKGGGGGGNAETLKAYWTTGEGAGKIRWGEGGDFDRCVRLLEEETKGAGLDVHGYCANLHHRALGFWPATHKKMLHGAGWDESKHPRDKGGEFAHLPGGGGKLHGLIEPGSAAHDDLQRGLDEASAKRVRDHLDAAHAAQQAGNLTEAEDRLIAAKNAITYGGTAPALRQLVRQALADVQRQIREKKQQRAAAGDGPGLLQVPSLVTLPGVDIVAAGRWKLASGEQTFTSADLRHAVHAAQCPAVGPPVIKVGHVDPRFDGEPAVGRVLNMAVTAEGNKITGDLAGMPGWLGAVAASAYPRRSIEGTYDFQCQIGHVHPFVITGLALLGVTPPGVGVLGGLRDVAGLYGVQAAAQSGASWRLDAGGEMPGEVTARAVTEMDVRRAYYESPGVAMSLWITELQMDPAQLIVADEATSKVYRVPFHIEAGAITFGDAAEVAVNYADVAAGRGSAGVVMVYASAEESRNVAAAPLADDAHGTTPGSEQETAGACTECGGSGKVAGGATCPHCHGTGREPASASADDPAAGAPGGGDGPASVSATPEVTASWDGGAAVAALGTDPSAGQIRAMFALPGATKSDSSLPHHNVSGGQVGAPNPDGCSAAIAAINGARGGLKGQGPDKLRSAYNHLAAHLRAAGRTPPPFKAAAEDHPAGIKIDAAGRHGAFTGTHSHPHAALGSQAGDLTHDHGHTHKGDGRHAHVHAAGTTEGGSEVEFTEDQMTALRSAFGLGEDEELTADQLVQAAGALRERADATKVTASRAPLPPGVITVEQEAWDALHQRVRAGEEYRAAQLRGERDTVIAAAVTAGKFSTAQMERWRRLWDRDPDGTREVLASLAPNVVPVEDIGGPGGVEEMDGDYARLFSKDYVAATRRPGV